MNLTHWHNHVWGTAFTMELGYHKKLRKVFCYWRKLQNKGKEELAGILASLSPVERELTSIRDRRFSISRKRLCVITQEASIIWGTPT